MQASADELIALPDIGGIVAESIVGFFNDPIIEASIDTHARTRCKGRSGAAASSEKIVSLVAKQSF